jgi:hypothetical protein
MLDATLPPNLCPLSGGKAVSQSQPKMVPQLDLAPKLRRPLSLWNPLDYLRLLYWVFYFPQALRWYVDTFGGGYIPNDRVNRRKALELLRQNRVQQQLFLQGLLLAVIVPSVISLVLQKLGVPVDWGGVALSVAGGLASGMVYGMDGVAGGVALSVVGSVAGGVAFGVGFGMSGRTLDVARGVAGGVAFFVASGVVIGMVSSVVVGVASGVVVGVASLVELSVLGGIVFGGIGGMNVSMVACLAFGMAASVAVSVALLRLDMWVLNLPIALWKPIDTKDLIPAVTIVPVPQVSAQLKTWLRNDWETGLHNVNQLLAYTLQFIPVSQAVNQVLAELPSEQVIVRVAQLAESPYDWQLIRFASASLTDTLKWSSQFLNPAINRRSARQDLRLHLDTPARAVAAGFWCLYKGKLKAAAAAFATVHALPYGAELLTLAQTLTLLRKAKHPLAIASLQLPVLPETPLLRPVTWESIGRLRRVVEDVQMVQQSVSRSTRAFAFSRALGEIAAVLNNAHHLPEAERGLILTIAQTWQEALLSLAGEVGDVTVIQPIRNPYVIGDPVRGGLFVGREDVVRQLEELWVLGNQLQSVVLFGHRRMGKTSILLNVTTALGAGLKVAYVNLLRSAYAQSIGDVLMAICDEVSRVMDLPPPQDADLLQAPYRTFERYLKQVETKLGAAEGLIIAIDEFEQIENLIQAGRIESDLMAFLRGVVQMSSQLAFAFAGLHTLEEMTEDYFHPFFASVIPIKVGFLSFGATRQLLANPHPEFLLNYTAAALEEIWFLTAGQPYLTQLIGFQLVRHYNNQVFEQGQQRNLEFTIEDVRAVVGDHDFFSRGRYYFTGVWEQAGREVPAQQPVLQALAPHQSGLSLDALKQKTGLSLETLQQALQILERHDVVQETEGYWLITVELFRQWISEMIRA